uniref:Uncharacterized protein n=1 Tax=Parascaris equorum TaxID=6256 RepID=A0A914R5G7_PAREQ
MLGRPPFQHNYFSISELGRISESGIDFRCNLVQADIV